MVYSVARDVVYDAVKSIPVCDIARRVDGAISERKDLLWLAAEIDTGSDQLVVPYGANTVSRDIFSGSDSGREWRDYHFENSIPYSALNEELNTRMNAVLSAPDLLDAFGLSPQSTVEEYLKADTELGEAFVNGVAWSVFCYGLPSKAFLFQNN